MIFQSFSAIYPSNVGLAAEFESPILRRHLLSGDQRARRCDRCFPRNTVRQKLLSWRSELLQESSETLRHLQEESLSEPDIADRASLETDRSLELRTRDRERKLIARIDDALQRIEEGTYGYCEETSEPISLRRLEARPIATLSIEAQERHERMERTHRDD
jgi:DnaK suppressor protein